MVPQIEAFLAARPMQADRDKMWSDLARHELYSAALKDNPFFKSYPAAFVEGEDDLQAFDCDFEYDECSGDFGEFDY